MTRTKYQVSPLGPRTQSNTDPGGFDVQPLDRHKVTSNVRSHRLQVLRSRTPELQHSQPSARFLYIMWTLSPVACWLLLQSVSSQTTNTTQSPMLNTQNCQQGNGASYRGTASMTETGKTCQRWDSQTPHHHTRTHVNYPLAGLEHNYCRNPDGWNQVWCYTTDPNQRWENCDVPVCVCDKRLTGDDGTFTSPNYPNLYPNGNECRYEISVTPPKVVRLTFTDFNLEERSDFLYVYDGNTTDEAWEIKRLHGENIPSPITSTRSIMTVRFTSNLSGNLKGFQANYTAVEKVLSTCEVGQFLCDDGVTCIKAWERCDGNNDCRDGEDEDANTCACQDIPESLRMCSDLEYNKLTLANPLNSAYTTVDDIARSNQFNAYRDLAVSGCHPRIKDYVCALIAPRCNSSFSPNPRQMLPCRSWCEEVKYSCKHQPTWSIFPTCDMFHYNDCNNVRPSRTETGVECFNGNGANYRGDEYRDPIGEGDCNRWDADIHPKKYPWSNLVDNKCRNPPVSARDIRPWCFTSSGFEYCDIMPCNIDHKYKLQKDLLSETVYNVEVAPTTNLYIKAYVVNIINLDEKAEQIVTSYKAEWTWKDDRLTWDPERYGDFDHVFVSDELVWQPTLTLERNADTRYSGDFPNTEVRIDNDGEVTWPIAALASTTCTLDPFLFPQDNMTCAICWTVGEDYTIGCANQTTHHDTKVKNKNFLTCLNPEADIVTGEWTGKTTASSSNNEACLTITLKRDPTYHYSTTISLPVSS
ncbi:apolipoprotein(a)-like isoform X3 [Branchiostoma floridae x Branchiostoma belcheri]